MSRNYTITELLAMPDDDLNALAAELRGWTISYGQPWHNEDDEFIRCDVYNDHEGAVMPVNEWSPYTNRNQSYDLLTWAADQTFEINRCTVIFEITIDSAPRTARGIHAWSSNGMDFEVPGNGARAETIAFCAAMLAMAGRLAQ